MEKPISQWIPFKHRQTFHQLFSALLLNLREQQKITSHLKKVSNIKDNDQNKQPEKNELRDILDYKKKSSH